MQSQQPFNSSNIEEVVKRIFESRRITRADQQKLMTVLLSKEALSFKEHEQIDRVFDALRRGLLRVVD